MGYADGKHEGNTGRGQGHGRRPKREDVGQSDTDLGDTEIAGHGGEG